MTTFDRIEQRMPDLMGELAPARTGASAAPELRSREGCQRSQ